MPEEATALSSPYCGPAPGPEALMSSWNTDPVLLLALGVMLVAGVPRAGNRSVFLLAWGFLVLAFVSPLCALTSALFSARALHHLLILGVIAPCLAMSLPLRRTAPTPAFALTALALVAWHIPAVYSAAWESRVVYWLMQALLLLPAWGFWSAVVATGPRNEGFATALMIGALAGIMGLIGAVLTFSNHLLYPEHLVGPLAWGLDPLSDQRAAGLLMWVPGLLPSGIVAAIIARRAWARGLAA
ncbi:cytochrome c oxidase assembly protein [Falsigemmobacter faecalis]|uniref:Cytochrome c oxidase assembly protein n=1 Tax=Falsigemmobacter faecalis TaxID=2488730 RepID=A0A3P3DEQ9_9RHOB|nr:cytochrome c oxidase assembly protein [Falsigemmobacter faecalis]RRH72771.1 cytochrome c oxidase assembly protein [Falsigemmobacter faecalis]